MSANTGAYFPAYLAFPIPEVSSVSAATFDTPFTQALLCMELIGPRPEWRGQLGWKKIALGILEYRQDIYDLAQ